MLSGTGHHRCPRQSATKGLIATAPAPATYTVVSGDWPSKIAASHNVQGGWQKLYDRNKNVLTHGPDLIFPGQKLVLGDDASAIDPAPAQPAAPAARPATSATASQSGGNVIKTVSGSATYFGDSTEYQPLACGGNSRDITQGVALWTVPCGTEVRITSTQTGKSVVATVADRGPGGRTGVAIDLLPGTWDALGAPWTRASSRSPTRCWASNLALS
jgi:rare lipoprotein A (peptidoglycan hydrolase)